MKKETGKVSERAENVLIYSYITFKSGAGILILCWKNFFFESVPIMI